VVAALVSALLADQHGDGDALALGAATMPMLPIT
jgi:hypothetical protein